MNDPWADRSTSPERYLLGELDLEAAAACLVAAYEASNQLLDSIDRLSEAVHGLRSYMAAVL